jgi:hypothetical protein
MNNSLVTPALATHAPPASISAPIAHPTAHPVRAVSASTDADTASRLVEFAEQVNAATVREMQRAHREELTRVHAELRRVRRQFEGTKVILDEFETAVVEIDGRAMTLWSAYELGVGRPLCGVCRKETCHGCAVSDRELRAEYELEAHDRE